MMHENWLAEFEKAIHDFLDNATDEQLDEALERANASFFNTITERVFTPMHYRLRMPGAVRAAATSPAGWQPTPAAAAEWEADAMEAHAANDNFALAA